MANFVKLNGYDVEDTIARAKINNIGNYSTTEVDTGKTWIDGKTIYRKVINFGAFPTGANKQVAHNITNLDKVIDIKCIATNSLTGKMECNPYYMGYSGTISDLTFFEVYINTNYVNVDRNPYDSEYNCPITDSYVIIEYTKSN